MVNDAGRIRRVVVELYRRKVGKIDQVVYIFEVGVFRISDRDFIYKGEEKRRAV